MAQITLSTGPERRRRWSDEERERILAAAFAPGAVVANIARQFEVSTSLSYKWREQALAAGQFWGGLCAGCSGWRTGAHERAGAGTCGDPRRTGQRVTGEDQPARFVRTGYVCPAGVAMIPIGSGVRIWIATGHTDMRRGMNGLARQVQENLGRDPFAGDVFVFRGRSGKHTTFNIQFASRDDCVSVASVVRADAAGLSTSARQGSDVHLHGRTS